MAIERARVRGVVLKSTMTSQADDVVSGEAVTVSLNTLIFLFLSILVPFSG